MRTRKAIDRIASQIIVLKVLKAPLNAPGHRAVLLHHVLSSLRGSSGPQSSYDLTISFSGRRLETTVRYGEVPALGPPEIVFETSSDASASSLLVVFRARLLLAGEAEDDAKPMVALLER